ncbi:hypothetical protein STEG23_017819 [Scotinomys teguina]
MVRWPTGEADDKRQFEKPYRDAMLRERVLEERPVPPLSQPTTVILIPCKYHSSSFDHLGNQEANNKQYDRDNLPKMRILKLERKYDKYIPLKSSRLR